MSKHGKFIVIDGIQGAGKTLQMQKLVDALRAKGIATYVTREPGGNNRIGRIIRTLTHDPRVHLTTKTEVLLYAAARVELLELVKKMLARGVWVISERSYITGIVMQYYARNDDLNYEDVERICHFSVGDTEPHLTLILDLDAATAEKKIRTTANVQRFDNLKRDFLQRVRAGYLAEAKKRRYPIIDASKSEDAVAVEVLKIVGRLK